MNSWRFMIPVFGLILITPALRADGIDRIPRPHPDVTAAILPWFEFRVKDFEKPWMFYQTIFGWKCVEENMPTRKKVDKKTEAIAPGFKGCIIVHRDKETGEDKQVGEVIQSPIDPKSDGPGDHVLIYLPVDDTIATFKKVLAYLAEHSKGASPRLIASEVTIYPPMNIPDGHEGSIAVFRGPEGIPIGIFSKNSVPDAKANPR